MNTSAKKELMCLLGLGAVTSYLMKKNRLAITLGLSVTAVAISTFKKPYSFRGKVVVITGGSRGLGLALAKRFAKEGARVCLLARDENELARAEEILSRLTSTERIQSYACDITDTQQLNTAIDRTLGRWGDIDVWVNNAGSILIGPFESMHLEDFEAQMKLHLYANITATQRLLPIFRKKRDGRIINICSMGGKVAVPHMLPYDSSKFALAGFSQGITAEFAKENIAVTTVYPTLMRTGSPIQAVFKGNSKKEFSWFANADVFPGFSISADQAAEKIIEASRERKSELIPTFIGNFRVFIGTLFPEVMLSVMGFMNRLMPSEKNLMYRTGAQCLTDSTYLSQGQKNRAEQAESELNQMQKNDPEFNLGLH